MELFWPLMVAALVVVSIATFWTIRQHRETAESTQAADWTVSAMLGGAAICASWTQATAVYGSGIYAAQGPWYFAMLYVPNVLSIPIILAPYISSRRLVPDGLTLGQYMGEVYGPLVRVQITLMQQGIVIGSSVGSLIAARDIFPLLLGYQPQNVGRIAVGFSLFWVIVTGLRGGLMVDRFKVAFLFVLVGCIGYLWWSAWGSIQPIPTYTKAAEPVSTVMWSYGIALMITLFGAVFCFPDMFERTNAVEKRPKSQTRAIIIGAVLFAVFLAVFGSNGFLTSYTVTEPYKGFPAFVALKKFGSPSMIALASASLAVILTSGLAAYAASFGSLGSVDDFQWAYTSYFGVKPPEWARVWVMRLFMPVPLLVALWIVETWPGLRLPDLLEYSAAFRGEAIAPVAAAPILIWLGFQTRKYGNWIGLGMLIALSYGVVVNLKFFGIHVYEESSYLGQNAKTLSALGALFFPIIGFCIRHFIFTPRVAGARLQSAE